MLKLLPALLLTFNAAPALAAETEWQDLALGAKARLISSDFIQAGKTTIGLELDLPPGTNTYWRIPGETGIPTEFDFSGSAGVADPAVQWPYPEIEDIEGFRDYVYRGHLVLPIEVKATGTLATLNVAITMGVCSDLCVPATASFALPLSFGGKDAEQSTRLQMAAPQLPADWDRAQEPFGPISFSDGHLNISSIDDDIDPASIIADVGDPAVLFAAPQKSPDGNVWSLKLLGEIGAGGLAGRSVELTFMTRRGPYAVTRRIGPAS
jgi:DsbC/DsbD-like thiol-disulfide interchange protein